MVFILDDGVRFPPPQLAEEDGLLAIGGELTEEWLLLAYSQGIFPWYSFRGDREIHWYCPQRRFVIFPKEIHLSHSLRTLMRKQVYKTSFNQDFDAVIDNCSRLRVHEEGAWLGPDMVAAYKRLNRSRHAYSVEVTRDGVLVGGLYGVMLKGAFFGESMFSLEPSTSKLALVFLARCLDEMGNKGGKFIDCQFETPHLRSMGGRFISYDTYMSLLSAG